MSPDPSRDRARDEIEGLNGLAFPELKKRHLDLTGNFPPKHIGRKLLILAVAYEIQQKGHRRLVERVQRRLSALSEGRRNNIKNNAPKREVKPGGRLIREWRGKSYEVYVAEDGAYWNGRRYTSLSSVATAITGVKWNGPRFFGLRSPRMAS